MDCRRFLSRRRPSNTSRVPSAPAVHQLVWFDSLLFFSDTRLLSAALERAAGRTPENQLV